MAETKGDRGQDKHLKDYYRLPRFVRKVLGKLVERPRHNDKFGRTDYLLPEIHFEYDIANWQKGRDVWDSKVREKRIKNYTEPNRADLYLQPVNLSHGASEVYGENDVIVFMDTSGFYRLIQHALELSHQQGRKRTKRALLWVELRLKAPLLGVLNSKVSITGARIKQGITAGITRLKRLITKDSCQVGQCYPSAEYMRGKGGTNTVVIPPIVSTSLVDGLGSLRSPINCDAGPNRTIFHELLTLGPVHAPRPYSDQEIAEVQEYAKSLLEEQ
jgi:hypothetical protein